ncbi:MAG: hypothetical protein M1814_006034 [Vezdaea aestivalis]|nr:MAG: hypothetical protein M1814_006034 [Vezdaea aestivalis]
MAYFSAGLETPRTENATAKFHTDSLLDLSIEPSFHSPTRGRKNGSTILTQNGRKSQTLKTPNTRTPLLDRRNGQPPVSNAEFTPLLKSAHRNLARQRGKENNRPEMPAILRGGLESIAGSPALPVNSSGIFQNEGSSIFAIDEAAAATPLPPIASSSAMSTPLAMLPKKDGGGAPDDGGRVLSLREQEEIVGKIEKENFGLKLKIHFLEEALQRKDPKYNEAALKENTDLKVDKVTLTRELSRYRKTLSIAERDLQLYRQQLTDAQENMRKRHADEGQREELEGLRKQVEEKDAEIVRLRDRQNDDKSGDIGKLQGQVDDLEADLREKERQIDAKDDEIEELKDSATASADAEMEHENEVATLNHRIRELEDTPADNAQQDEEMAELEHTLKKANSKIDALEADLQRRQLDLDEALSAKTQAESDLEAINGDMADKSFHAKGLNRQLEGKAMDLQGELEKLRSEHAHATAQLQAKTREVSRLQSQTKDESDDFAAEKAALQDKVELCSHERDVIVREQKSIISKLSAANNDLEKAAAEKDSLASQIDSLTRNGERLQSHLDAARSKIQELEGELEAAGKDILTKSQGEGKSLNLEIQLKVEEIEHLKDEYEDLRMTFDENERHFDSEQDKWDNERQNLESRCKRSEDQVAALGQSLSKLREVEGTLSHRELRLQEVLRTEQDRHQRQEASLNRQIEGLNSEINVKRQHLDASRDEAAKVRDELRASKREETTLKDKIQALDDEIDVLQASLEDEGGFTTRLQSLDDQLANTRREKKSVQERCNSLGVELRTIRSTLTEVEAERDELQSQLNATRRRMENSAQPDKEKMDLRTTKIRLESEVTRLKEEKVAVSLRAEELQHELDDELEKAGAEETRLELEIEELRKQLATTSDARDRELKASRRAVQKLELRVEDLGLQLQATKANGDGSSELELLRNDLSAARRKEADYVQREGAQKDTLRGMRRRVADLERAAHEAELQKLSGPSESLAQSPFLAKELANARHQLQTSHKELRTLRTQLRAADQEHHAGNLAKEQELLSQLRKAQSERDVLRQELEAIHATGDQHNETSSVAESTIQNLRQRTSRLERDLRDARSSVADFTIIQERKDLHNMLKETKLEVEDLRAQLRLAQEVVDSSEALESDLRTQLKRIRAERSHQSEHAAAASRELNSVQQRYERTLDKMIELQKALEAERTALARGISAMGEVGEKIHGMGQVDANGETLEQKEDRHSAEMSGMIKQIGYLKARFQREQGFRMGLVLEKWYMQQQIKQYDYYNKVDIKMLRDMGIKHEPKTRERKPRTLRVVGLMVMAVCRMQTKQQVWKEHLRTKEELTKIAADLGLTRTGKQIPSVQSSPPNLPRLRMMGGASSKSQSKGKERAQPAKKLFSF